MIELRTRQLHVIVLEFAGEHAFDRNLHNSRINDLALLQQRERGKKRREKEEKRSKGLILEVIIPSERESWKNVRANI